MNNYFLYVFTVLIWGSTWLAIKFQLGVVDPMISVTYRFTLAALLLLAYCKVMGLKMTFTRREHLFIALQGLLLFSFNYWLVYLAEVYLTSGLVAVIFSMIIFMNITNGRWLLGSPISPPMVLGALTGVSGLALIFWPEISSFTLSDLSLRGFLFGFAGAYLASLGNILSARNQKHSIPVIQTNAFGMAYGASFLLVFSFLSGKPFAFEFTLPYVFSLLYLSVLGSIVAFGFYLTLLGRIGADRAAYVTLLIPVVALCISTLFEGYRWSGPGFTGLGLVLAGNVLVLRERAMRFSHRRRA
jgi:drug/metabolite transporter (DMT)-like permease